ncbi:hypothetical protein PIB30_060016 [Stylosanthes scabra]|uniref:Uncharacterized protein n=1 Tax=Stylosanthes scabra TaxID=79078 RepID=A0ABU6XIP2_9FABA|nr:hypothetical protein [Stylosanthes scabra]
MYRDEDKEHEGTTMLPYEILNEWHFKEINKVDRIESESSDWTATWNYGRKECAENNFIIVEEVEVSPRRFCSPWWSNTMKLNGSFATNESVCSSGVGVAEGVIVGSHDRQLGSGRKEDDTNLKV